MSEIELLPCPFCGDEAVIWVDNVKRDEHIVFTLERGMFDFDRYCVKCRKCGIETGEHFLHLNPIERWNKRTEESVLAAYKSACEGYEHIIATNSETEFSKLAASATNGVINGLLKRHTALLAVAEAAYEYMHGCQTLNQSYKLSRALDAWRK